MAKALKIVGLVVGAAVIAVATAGTGIALAGGLSLGTSLGIGGAVVGATFGVSAGTLLLGAAALSTIGSALSNPQIPASQTNRLTASIDPRAFRKTVLGQTAMATDIRYEEWSGKDQEYCDWIVALASHAIDSVEEIWLEQEMAWSATTGVVAKYAGYFSVPNIVLEGSPANAFTFGSGKWNQSARLTGCAYLRLRFKVTGNSKKAESPFASSIPSRITIIGRGAKLYDPRRDSTVPGGSGPMRWNDQSTWRYTTDDGAVIGENLALQILRVVLGWRIRNPVTGEMRLATGSGVPGRRLDLVSFQVAANLCDELVNRSAGGTEPRYHGAGVISEGDDPKQTLDMLCAACCGRFRDTGGKLALVIAHNDLAVAAADDGLNDDDVIGAFTWDPDPALEGTPNVGRGRYVDATSASLYQLIDYPEVRIASLDGQDRIMTLDLGVVESVSQAQRIVKQVLERRQYQRSFSAPFDIRAWKYPVGAVVPFTFAPLGFTRALFRVASQELGQDGVCNMTLSVEHQVIYSWDASDAPPVLAAEPIVYDKGNNPLILGINEAATMATAVVLPGASIGGTIAPDGTVVGGTPASTFVDAIAELTSTPDPDKQIEGAKGLVDRMRETALTQIKNQLLAFARKTRTDSATHLDGIPMGARVRTEITERIEQGLALAQQIVEVEAAITGPDGPIAAAVTQLTQAIADGDHAQALSLQALDAAITGPDGPIAAAVTQLTQAVADANSARAEAFDQLQAAITANGDALDAAFTQLNQAVVTEHDARVQADTDLKAEITGPSGPIAAAVSQLNLALATQQSATAQMIADLQASITGPQGALTAQVARLDQAIVDESGVRASSITTLKSAVDGQTASIDVLFQTINGNQAIAQIAVTVDQNGTPVMTGLKINGQEHLFAIAADRFVVGNSLIFEVDSTTGTVYMNNVVVGRLKAQSVTTDALVDNSVTGFTSISGLTGQLDSTLTSTISDAFYVPSHYGKVMRLDVNFNIALIPGQNPSFFMQLYRDGGPITRAFQLNSTSATNGGFPAFFTIIDTPSPGIHSYQLFFSRYNPISGGGAAAAGIRYSYGAIYAQEFYK
ncbi:hypothetical protein PX554_13820 [Sphingomonas sp. H39-1-10]|uniref:hypothetical protein n=1 Tax=Sphingomonas pollutisoli TaxID=3030829 RepID=UPI0023B8AD73|nr:hypothetical protein [Sphingomonas pollutisoli]MDF0489214.1 hypothetical protein [Sphingomonas pollutisoli]